MSDQFDDPYFKQRLEYRLKDEVLRFDTAALLFSPFEIDPGTALLLKAMIDQHGRPRSILELGCNYGAIGIVLARLNPRAEVILADKDLLAVRYARHNSELNGTTNVTVAGSIGVEKVPARPFDLIVSNIPAKIGDKAIEHDFVLRPLERLNAGWSYWFIAESQLNRLIPGIARRHKLHLAEVNRQAGQIVFRIRKP